MFGTRPPCKLLLLDLSSTKQTINTHHPFSLCCLTRILTSRVGRSVHHFWLASQSIVTVRPRLIIFRTSDSKASVISVQIFLLTMSPGSKAFDLAQVYEGVTFYLLASFLPNVLASRFHPDSPAEDSDCYAFHVNGTISVALAGLSLFPLIFLASRPSLLFQTLQRLTVF